MADEGKVGEASVDIIANIVVDEESLASAQQQIGTALGKDTAPRSETRKGAKQQVDVEAKVKTVGNIHDDIQKAIDKDDYQLTIDTLNIREQIQQALKAPFQITISAEVQGAMATAGVGMAHGAAVATGGPAGRGEPPGEMMEYLYRKGKKGGRELAPFAKGIDELYRNINEGLAAAGKGRFGSQPLTPGNRVEKTIELMERFGDKVAQWVEFDPESPVVPRATGGTIIDFLREQGVGEEMVGTKIPTAIGAFGGENRRAQESFFSMASKWMQATPVTAQPHQANAEQTAQAVMHTLKQEGSLYSAPAALDRPMPVSDAVEAARKELRATLSRAMPTQPVVPEEYEQFRPNRTGARPSRPSADPEADLRAMSQLGGMRADFATRRMFGQFQPRSIGGIDVDIEPLLGAARAERFHNLFQTKEGDLHRFMPGSEEDEERLRSLREQRKPFTMAGFKGQVRNVNPTEAFWDAVSEMYDDEIATVLRNDPETKKLVRASLTQGGAAKPLVSPQPPQPGQGGGETGGIISASGTGFEKGYRAAYRLLETLDQISEVSADIDGLWAKIEDRQGSGKGTDKLEATVRKREDRLAVLEARARDLGEAALPIEATTPAQARILRAAEKARGIQDRTKGDIGLTEEEKLKKFISSPVTQGRRAREMVEAGQLPDPKRIVEEVMRRAESSTDDSLNTRQRIQGALREVRGELEVGLPDKGPIRQESNRMFGDIFRSIFGERERVEREANAPMMVDPRESRGGEFTAAQREADKEATRREGGTGRGRVAREVGSRLTGGQTNQGRPETEAILDRPTTDVDLRIGQLQGQLTKAAEREAVDKTAIVNDALEAARKKFGGTIKRTAGAAGGADLGSFESLSFPNAQATAQAEAFFNRSLAQRKRQQPDSGRAAAEAEIKRLHDVQREADAAMAALGGITGTSAEGTVELQRNAARVAPVSGDAMVEMLQMLEARTAEAARSTATRESRPVPGGDKTRETFKRAGGFVVGEPGAESPFAAFNARETNPPAGGPPAPPGGPSGGFEGVSGPIHVIVDNVPLQVAWAGGAPAGTGVSGKDAAVMARDKATMSRADVRRMTSEQNMKFVEEFAEKQRDAGKSDAQIKAALTKFGFGGTANLVLEDAGGAAGGAGVGPRDINARRARAGLAPIEARSEEFFTEIDTADKKRAELAAQARRAERGIPKRGFTASVTDIFSNLGGFLDEQVAAVSRYQREGQQLSTLLTKGPGIELAARQAQETVQGSKAALERAQADRDAAKASGANVRTIRELDRSIKILSRDVETGSRIHVDAQRKVEEYGVELEAQSKRVKSAEKELPGARGRAAAFGIGFAGAAGAIAVGTIVAQVGQALLQVVGETIGPAIERATGFAGTTARVTGGIADDTRARGGDVRAATAGAFAATGISDIAAQAFSPLIAQRAEVEAGNKALKEQVDLLHTQQNLLRDQAQAGQFDRGLSATTGGLFGTSLFGVPSTAELVKNELNAIPENPTVLGMDLNEVATAMSMTQPGSKQMEELAKAADSLIVQLAEGESTLKLFNGQAEKGGSALRLVADAAVAEKSAAMAREVGLNELADSFIKSGRGVQGAQTGEDIQSFLAAVNRGSTTPSSRLILEQTERERRAQVQLQDRQREFALRTTQPQAEAIGLAGQGFGVGGPTGAGGINFGGLSASETKRLNTELDDTKKLYSQINAEVDVGIRAAKEFVSEAFSYDPSVGQEFAKSLDLAAGYGREIASIQIGMETKQAAFQAQQYAYQINIAKRSLADARGLAGQITGESKNNLGILEREQFFLQRRAQMLQLELSQRQINFQRSIAGFTAPGLTGEERAARIQQAKIEAEYAQKQLDIQKQLFRLGGQQFTIQASRAVTDLVGQLGLLERGRVLNVETAVAEKRIKILSALQEQQNKRVQTYYEAAIARTNDIMVLEAQMVAATGEALTTITTKVLKAFAATYAGITDIINSGPNVNPYTGFTTPDNTNAEGYLGMAQGTTSIGPYGVAGEAGGEAVAILRDPHQLMTPMAAPSGGGLTVQIVISGNKFTSEEEEDRVMRKLTQAVKDAQDRDFALRGLRN